MKWWLCFCFAIFANAVTPAEVAEVRFADALELATTDTDAAQAGFREAAEQYELLLQQEGIDRGKVLANAGRARFKAGDLGPAIAHLRNARRLRPWDAELRQDLAYVREQTLDVMEPGLARKVVDAAERVPLGWRFGALLGAYALFWCVWLGRRLACCPRAMQAVTRLAVVLLVVSSLLLVLEPLRRSMWQEAVVVAPSTIARKGDATVYESAFVTPLHSGTECQILDDRGDWLQVSLASGETCWLPRNAVAILE